MERLKQFLLKIIFLCCSENGVALVISVASLGLVFPQLFSGLIISNCVYAFNFEPWSHHASMLDAAERANPILSDSLDGSNANLNPTNVLQFSLARLLQLNGLVASISSHLLGPYAGASALYLYIFVSMQFFSYLYLRSIGVNWCISVSTSLAFTYGSTNMHYYGWAQETQSAILVLYFIERLLQKNRWIDCIWLTFSLVNFGGQQMVHVIVFYALLIICYAVGRLAFGGMSSRCSTKLVFCACMSLCVSADHIIPTIFHYTHYFESSYRENYGFRQNSWQTIFTFLFANFYGHPLSEANRWISGSYINTGMFVGSTAFLSACTLCMLRVIFRRDFFSIFFVIFALCGFCFVYQLPFESIEQYTGQIPVLRMAPPIYFKAILHLVITICGALGLQFLWNAKGRISLVSGIGSLVMMSFIYVLGLSVYEDINEINKGSSTYLQTYMPQACFGVMLSMAAIIGIAACNTHPRFESLLKWVCSPLLLGISIFETRLHTDKWVPFSRSETCKLDTEATSFLRERVANSRIISLGYAGVPSIINLSNYSIEMAAGRMSVSPPYRMLLQLADSNAYAEHPTQYLFSLGTDLNAVVWDLADVRYVLAPKNIDEKEVLSRHKKGTLKVYKLSDATIFERIPKTRHIYAFPEAQFFQDLTSLGSQVSTDWNPRKQIAVEAGDNLPQFVPSIEFEVQIDNFIKNKNFFSFDIDSNSNTYVLVSELYDPNWMAFAGTEKLTTFRSYFFLQGIVVPKGKHHVVIEYVYPLLRLANNVSIASLLGGAAFILYMTRKESKRQR